MKMYQAVSETICVADFGDELRKGWFATSKEALDAFKPSQKQGDSSPKEKMKPGPKPKVKEQ